MLVARALAMSGNEVTTVGDGVQALEAVHRISYALLVTDIVMPGLDGIALSLKVAKEDPPPLILLVTGYARNGSARTT